VGRGFKEDSADKSNRISVPSVKIRVISGLKKVNAIALFIPLKK
jgi:hypothetical protein